MIAFLPTLGFQEMVLLLVLGIVLFGRNLPDAGRSLGRTVSRLRRSMQEFRDQLDRDESVKGLRDEFRSTRDEVRRAGAVPRALANPAAAVRDLAKATLAAPLPPDDAGTADHAADNSADNSTDNSTGNSTGSPTGNSAGHPTDHREPDAPGAGDQLPPTERAAD